MSSFLRRGASLIASLAVAGLTAVNAPAHAAPAATGTATTAVTTASLDPQGDDPQPFYTPPATLPAGKGTIVRSEPATFLLDPLNLSSASVSATRIMYTSTDRAGRPIAVTGTVFVPRTAWSGPGTRPLISYAAGTQGMADRCAPSRQMAEMAEYEGLFFSSLIARGYAVVLTDYEGLGTPGMHTYMVRESQGHAVLDAARAAQRLPGTGLSASTPVGITGYSQGGGASAAAAELAPTYAPELAIKGAVAGAVPADLAKVAANLDGSTFFAFQGYAMLGLSAAYDVPLDPYLNAAGEELMPQLANSCVLDATAYAGRQSSTYTEDGRPVSALLAEQPWASIVADNRIGNRKPTVPVLVTHSMLDDVIPFEVGRTLAKDWCAKGANVRFSPNLTPTHIGGTLNTSAEQLAFFEARFAGLPQVSNCWTVQ